MQEKKKRPYEKPMMRFESFDLETPYATNCMASEDDMRDLMDLGYFTDQMHCKIRDDKRINPALDNETKEKIHDTICYHSNVIAAFVS